MDPRVREDDEITPSFLRPFPSFPRPFPSFLRNYTSFLRRQESIPALCRRLVQRAIAQVLHIGPAHQ